MAIVRRRSETVQMYIEDAKRLLSRLKTKKVPMFVLGMLTYSLKNAAAKAAGLGPKHDLILLPVIPLYYASSVEQMRWVGTRKAPCALDDRLILHTFKRATETYRPRRPYWAVVSPVERVHDAPSRMGLVPATIEEVLAFSLHVGVEDGQYIDAGGDFAQYMTVESGTPAVVPATPFVCIDHTPGPGRRVSKRTYLSGQPLRWAFRGERRRNVFIVEGGIIE